MLKISLALSPEAQEMGLSSCKEGPCTNPQDFLPPIALVRCRTTSKTLWNPPSKINLLVFGKLAKRSPRKISILSLRIKSKNIFSLRIKSVYSSFGSFCQRKLEKKITKCSENFTEFFLKIFQLNVSKQN